MDRVTDRGPARACESPTPEWTGLFRRWSAGEEAAADELLPALYRELHVIARAQMQDERPGHTLQPTALVSEAWLRLRPQHADWESRRHFFRTAARAMRSVLVDHARARLAGKRGGGQQRRSLEGLPELGVRADRELLELDELLDRLRGWDPELARIAELRLFAGLGFEDIAGDLGLSIRKTERGWRTARAWLRAELERE